MLDAVQELGESVSQSQIKDMKNILGEDLYSLLDEVFDSETEEDAKLRIDAFVAEAKKSPLKIMKARRVLDSDQKKLIMKFLEEGD